MTLQELLGIELPIIQAPMAGVQGSALAVAVSNAGAGLASVAMLDLDGLRRELAAIRARTTKPFNVNFFCHAPPVGQRRTRSPLARDADPVLRGVRHRPGRDCRRPGRAPFSVEAADVVNEYRPAVVSFHFGLPSLNCWRGCGRRGAKILSSATTVEEAIWLEAHGVDVIIAQGSRRAAPRACS